MKKICDGYMLLLLLILTAVINGCKMDLYTWPALENLSEISTDTLPIDQEQDGFRYRVPVTVDNSAQAEAFTDFPVLVTLNGSKGVLDNLVPDPGFHDLRFYTDDLKNRLSFEVEKWDPEGGECLIWVKVPSIQAGANPAAEFYLYYDYFGEETLPDYPKDVWTDGFLGVWHLDEGPGGPYEDSSPNGSDGTGGSLYGFNDPAPTVSGRIGGGQEYAASPDLSDSAIIVEGLNPSEHLGPVTFSLWHETITASELNGGRILYKGDGTDTRIDLYSGNIDGTYLDTEIYYDTTNQLLEEKNVFQYGPGVQTWHVIRWDGLSVTGTPGSRPAGIHYYNNGMYIGARATERDGDSTYKGDAGTDLIIGNDGDGGSGLSGIFDEVRISSVMRSEDWIAAQYASMTAAYLTFGAEELLSD